MANSECQPTKNIMCLNCWKVVEQHCGCSPLPGTNTCKCPEPDRFDAEAAIDELLEELKHEHI